MYYSGARVSKERLLFTLTVMLAWLHKQKLKRLQKKDQILLPDLEGRYRPFENGAKLSQVYNTSV